MYRAIGFDYGGVLAGEPSHTFGLQIIDLLGIDIETHRQAYFKFNKLVHRDAISWPELWRRYLEELGMSDKYQAVLKLNADYEASLQTVKPEMLKLATKLRKNGYKLGILSNNSQVMADRMREQDLERFFEVLHVSAEKGHVKPEPEAFLAFAHDLGVSVDELIFIDDSHKSLSTAKDVGYTPILYENMDKLVDDLQKLGIKV